MTVKKIAFITLGCKLNYAETSTYERGILGPEIEVVSANEAADAYLVNTCTVTEHSDKKSRNIIRHLHRTAPGAAIFVTGCYAELKRSEIEAIEGVRRVFGSSEKRLVVPAIADYLSDSPCHTPSPSPSVTLSGSPSPTPSAPTPASPVATPAAMFPAYSSGERTRSFLKVQDGCDFRCAYCTVPNARGRSRNIPIAKAVAQAREIAAKGIREIVLTGVNTGDFGRTTGETFLDLIRALNEVEGIERYRISSIEPNLLTEDIVNWIASGTKFLPHFHIPLQSGSDAILRAMGRRYTTADFERKIACVRRAMEGHARLSAPASPRPTSPTSPTPVFFGIDVIAGFPGETDELFEQTYAFLSDRIRPAFIHIFPYSRRAGTPAAARKDQVQDRVKTERVDRLERLCAELHSEFISRNLGRREKVLFESAEKDGMMFGYTSNYIRVRRPYDPALIGRIVDVVLEPDEILEQNDPG